VDAEFAGEAAEVSSLAQDLATARGKRYVVDFKTDCWEWFGPRDSMGYGRGHGGLAHRHFYIQRFGGTPNTLDHLCRNPCCVNPDHLEPISRGENIRRGIRAKLTWDLVTYIRESPLSNKELADELEVSPPTICNVRAGRNWKEEHRPT